MAGMTEENKETLFGALKNYLDITWPDEEGDKKLRGMMERGMKSLEGVIDRCDFTGETPEKSLLFNLVMYERAGDLDQFWVNYRKEIIALQIERKVSAYAAAEEPSV